MDALSIQYTGLPKTNLPGIVNNDLDAIIGIISTAINTSSSAPDYTSYSLACVTQTDGTSHPTNTQNFAEGISKVLCDFKTAYTTFSGTTYPAAITTLTNGINAIGSPALTYVPFSIVNTDPIATVWTKLFSGITGIISDIDPSTANWTAISVSPDPETIPDAFDAVILEIQAQTASIATKQSSLGTFDNSANCLAGGATDSALTTINLLRTYICSLPSYSSGAITWGSVTSSSTLNGAIQNLITEINYLNTYAQPSVGTGLSMSAVGGTYDGKSLSIDTSWTGLYKVKVDSSDTGDYLEDKIESSDGSISISNTGSTLDLTVTTPNDGKVLASSTDSIPGYLIDKIEVTSNSWGVTVYPTINTLGDKVELIIDVNSNTFLNSILDGIGDNPALLAKFCALKALCDGAQCGAIDNLVVTNNGTVFELTWTAVGGTSTSQLAKYRIYGTTSWLVANFSPANTLSASATSTDAEGLNVNTLYDFQVDTYCPSGIGASNLFQMIIFDKQTVTITDTAGVINVNQSPMPTVSVIEYRLLNNALAVIQNISATGLNPVGNFTAVSAGDYTLEYRQGTLVNGVMLYSDDATQFTEWYSEGPFAVS